MRAGRSCGSRKADSQFRSRRPISRLSVGGECSGLQASTFRSNRNAGAGVPFPSNNMETANEQDQQGNTAYRRAQCHACCGPRGDHQSRQVRSILSKRQLHELRSWQSIQRTAKLSEWLPQRVRLGQSATPTASPPSMVRDSCGVGRNHCLAVRSSCSCRVLPRVAAAVRKKPPARRPEFGAFSCGCWTKSARIGPTAVAGHLTGSR
jgi:hypothetical protein